MAKHNKTLLKIQLINIADVKPHPDNPRQHSKQQLRKIAQSIKQFGFRIPILVDKDYQIICGHGRVEACEFLGITEVPIIMADDLNAAQVRALMIADNRLTELSNWNEVLLGKNLQVLSDLDLDFDLEITGFDYGQIEQLIIGGESKHSEEETVELVNVKKACQSGDLWKLGNHLILCGDSRESSSYAVLMGDQQASMIFTDPPYNISAKKIGKVCVRQHGDFVVGSGEMSADEFINFLTTVFEHLCQWSKAGSIHFHCIDWRHIKEMIDAGMRCYRELKNVCVWCKDRPAMGSFYRSQHELIFVFKHGRDKHQNNFLLGQHGRTRSNVWHFPSARSLSAVDGDVPGHEALQRHPTIKPVRLIEEAILDCSRRQQIILDPFLGSGSTLIACEKTNRHCFGIEFNPAYVDVILHRFYQWTSIEPVHVSSGQTYNQRIDSFKEKSHV